MACATLQSSIQDLSTKRCFVSHFVTQRWGPLGEPAGHASRGLHAAAQQCVANIDAAGIGAQLSAGQAGDERGKQKKVAEPADKPGSVLDSHSSRRIVTDTLKQPTRTRRGQRHKVPIWSCSRWGLPCRSVARLAVRSYRTVSPLPRIPHSCEYRTVRRSTLCCTFRRLAPPRRYLAPCPVEPGLSSAPRRIAPL